MRAVIRGLGSYVPRKRLTNGDLSRTLETSDEWIFSHTGIRARHIAAEEEATSDLAFNAARLALEEAGVSARELDLILVATATPDHNGFPSTACIVQERLQASRAGAMDVVAACSGFVYGIETASSFIRSGSARRVLVVGAETLSRVVNWSDRNTAVLFGDGAGAAVLCAEEQTRSGVVRSILRSEGQGACDLIIPQGGTRRPFRADSKRAEDLCLIMDGRKVYNFAVRAIGETVAALLGEPGAEGVSHIVPHQANIRIIEAAAERYGIALSKFYLNIEEYANTSAASIPLALADMRGKGLLRPGDLVLTVGFGAGLTYGGNLIRW